jgi:flagellar hook-length control protein FliK
MNVQSTPSAAPTANTGTNAALAGRTTGKAAAGNAKDAAFSAVLGGQQGGQQAAGAAGQGGTAAQNAALADPGAETAQPDDQTLSLLALMQMLQALLATPLQNQTAAGNTSDQQQSPQQAQALPQLLLQVLSSPSKLSDKLLQDPNLQQWLAQAAALLPALTAAVNNATLPTNPALSTTTSPLAAASAGSAKQSALQTLLQFTDLVKQAPGDPIVSHLLADLQQASVPMLTNLIQSSPGNNESLDDALKQIVDNLTKPEAAQPTEKTVSSTKQPAISLPTIVVQSAPDNQVQQIKAKLEMLAAKSGGVAAVVQQVQAGSTSEQGTADESTQQHDATPFQMPALPLQDLLKTLQQAEATVKDPTATINAQTFVRDMSDYIVKNMKVSLGDVFKEATISLHPENLGQVDIKITLHSSGQLIAQLTADTSAGKQLLESQLPQLRQALQNQGLQVERLEVAQEASASSGMFQQPRQRDGDGQPFGRESRERKAEIDAVDGEFANDLRTLADHRSEQDDSSGSSFNATA